MYVSWKKKQKYFRVYNVSFYAQTLFLANYCCKNRQIIPRSIVNSNLAWIDKYRLDFYGARKSISSEGNIFLHAWFDLLVDFKLILFAKNKMNSIQNFRSDNGICGNIYESGSTVSTIIRWFEFRLKYSNTRKEIRVVWFKSHIFKLINVLHQVISIIF